MKKVLLLVFVVCLWQMGFGQSGQWTWMKGDSIANNKKEYGVQGISSPSNNPCGRIGCASWTDISGNFWLFGGIDSTGNYLNDLWKYNVVINEWTWIKGTNLTNSMGHYGNLDIADIANYPGGREYAATCVDKFNNLWLFGGDGMTTSTNFGYLNDLWKYNPSTNEWTWVSGDTLLSPFAAYGILRVPSILNKPGGRRFHTIWADNVGNPWLFGGDGIGQKYTTNFNDVWKYNTLTNEWTWMKGDSVTITKTNYGTKGISSDTSLPSARSGVASWVDTAGNLWMLGGRGFDINGQSDWLNDLWKFDISTLQWTWINGDSIKKSPGIYGILNMPSSLTKPGGRFQPYNFTDHNGKMWLFGGVGYSSSTIKYAYLNDLWKYDPTTNEWTWLNGDSVHTNLWGTYGTKGVSSTITNPGSRSIGAAWCDKKNSLWLYGGYGQPVGNTIIKKLNDLWRYTPDSAAFPVHLLTFTAQLKDNSAVLNWQVEAEQNFDRYQIERSPNGKDFTPIGAVKAANKKEYSYTDNVSSELAVVSNQNSQLSTHNSLYYRLKLIDRDGSFTYSPIRQINIKHSTLNIFPNPAHNIVTITGDKLKTITLVDNAGRMMLTKGAMNDNTIEISVGHLPKGLYLLTVTTTNGNTQSEKLIIE